MRIGRPPLMGYFRFEYILVKIMYSICQFMYMLFAVILFYSKMARNAITSAIPLMAALSYPSLEDP